MALAAAMYACAGLLAGAPELPMIEGAEAVGSQTCATCHADVVGSFGSRAHGIMAVERGDSCESCHGLGSKHLATLSPAEIRDAEVLAALSASQKSQLCLNCHSRDVGAFRMSHHADAGVSCWSCHADALHRGASQASRSEAGEVAAAAEATDPWDSIVPVDLHGRGGVGALAAPLGGDTGAQFCYQCHASTKADFLLQFHHPVPEGRMTCTDCHSVHGSTVLQDMDRGSTKCLSCHNEIAGPWVFEHLAMEDGCVTCHSPHGSTVEKLLRQADNAMCEQCHFDARYPLIGGVDHTRLLSAGALCVDCHSQVHGSNTDENLNPLRIEELLRGPR